MSDGRILSDLVRFWFLVGFVRIRSDSVRFGQTWSVSVGFWFLVWFGQIWLNLVGFGRIRSDFHHWYIWSDLVRIGRNRSDLDSDSVRFSQIQSDSVGLGWIRSDLVRIGVNLSDLVGVAPGLLSTIKSINTCPIIPAKKVRTGQACNNRDSKQHFVTFVRIYFLEWVEFPKYDFSNWFSAWFASYVRPSDFKNVHFSKSGCHKKISQNLSTWKFTDKSGTTQHKVLLGSREGFVCGREGFVCGRVGCYPEHQFP